VRVRLDKVRGLSRTHIDVSEDEVVWPEFCCRVAEVWGL
jgi:hypothetical protein